MAIRFFALMLCFGAVFNFTGCGEPAAEDAVEAKADAGHDAHAEPSTPAEAIELIEINAQAIKSALASGNSEAAHGPLHNVGDAINSVSDMAISSESLDEEGKAAVANAVEDLFAGFGSLDEMFHGGAEASYADVEGKITDAINVLKAKLN